MVILLRRKTQYSFDNFNVYQTDALRDMKIEKKKKQKMKRHFMCILETNSE